MMHVVKAGPRNQAGSLLRDAGSGRLLSINAMTQSEVPRRTSLGRSRQDSEPGHFRLGRLNEAALIWQGNCLFGKKIAIMGIQSRL